MDIEKLREYCLQIPGAEESLPFGPDWLVFKVWGNMFALIPLDGADKVSVKCNPDYALELRDRYRGIEPAWHFNKKYWNQIWFDRDVPDDMIFSLINHSVEEVVRRWSKKKQLEYAQFKLAESRMGSY